MTKAEAIKELTRCADLCPTTPLAEACRMAVDALGESLEHVALIAAMRTGCRAYTRAINAL